MDSNFYFLSPVEVVKVTSQNLEEVAEWCGGSVQETESRRVPGRMDKYVWVPTPKGNNISWAFPGMFITKRLVVTVKDDLRATWAVFRRDYFEKNYFKTNSDAGKATWEREILEKDKRPEVEVNVSVQQAMTDAVKKIAEKNGVELTTAEVEEVVSEQTPEALKSIPDQKAEAHEEAVEEAAAITG